MDLQLKDKVVIVTGGAKGIGAAITRACSTEGAVLVIVDRDTDAGKAIQQEFQKIGAVCELISVDVESPENCAQAVTKTVERFGRIDALVNNAGHNDKVGLEQGSLQDYVALLQRNLVQYYSMAHHALPYLKRSCGSIVNIGSKTAVTGEDSTSGYASSKGAVMALTREWAAELLPYGIRVNMVVPVEEMSPFYRGGLGIFPNPEEKLNEILSEIPLEKRMTTAKKIASMAVFLISAKSSHTNGQHLFVDGGYVHLDRAFP